MEPKTTHALPPKPATASPDTTGKGVDESLLTVHDVAMLASGSTQLPRPSVRRFAAVSRTDPRFAGHYEALEALARDAGFSPVRDQDLETALHCHRDFERLLEAEGWQDPAEVLDPEGEIGISYRELAHIAAARASRAGDTGWLAVAREKLEQAWSARRERDAPVVSFVTRLLEHDLETAEHLLRQASIEHQRRRTET